MEILRLQKRLMLEKHDMYMETMGTLRIFIEHSMNAVDKVEQQLGCNQVQPSSLHTCMRMPRPSGKSPKGRG